MNKIRNFQCKSGETFERWVDDRTTEVRCNCGKTAHRLLSAPKHFGNTTGRSPSRH